MTKLKKINIFLLSLTSLLFLTSQRGNSVHQSEASSVNKDFVVLLSHFQKQINIFEKTGSKENFLRMRIAFKRCEYLLCYADNRQAKALNGPNLIVNEYDSLNPNEQIMPHGLQVIEYHLYQGEEDSRHRISEEVQLLKKSIGEIKKKHLLHYKSDDPLFNSLVWDAWRQELFRLEALGLTGFDTPDCKNALPEAIAVLESYKRFLKIYWKSIAQEELKEVLTMIKSGIRFIKSTPNFEQFNRLDFFRNYLHPLQKSLLELQKELNFQFPSNIRPVNNNAEHLYDMPIFNDAYFNSSATTGRIQLGKMLFNDSILSLNNSRSCTTCHDPKLAFTDGKRKNSNFKGTKELLRNTPTMINAGWQTKFFYDSKVKNLEKQAIEVIHNPDEMGGDLKIALQKIKENDNYVDLFRQNYNGNINESTIVNALSNYIKSLKAFNSRTDRFLRGENIELSSEEKEGFNLFTGKAKCATCHFLPLYNGLLPPFYVETESEKIGVPKSKNNPKEIDPDFGRYLYTRLELHRYAFKTPSLRMISKTAPYMHNGVFDNLEEVIDFYNKGGGAGQGMDFPEQTLPSDSLRLSKKEQKSLITFLESLSE